MTFFVRMHGARPAFATKFLTLSSNGLWAQEETEDQGSSCSLPYSSALTALCDVRVLPSRRAAGTPCTVIPVKKVQQCNNE